VAEIGRNSEIYRLVGINRVVEVERHPETEKVWEIKRLACDTLIEYFLFYHQELIDPDWNILSSNLRFDMKQMTSLQVLYAKIVSVIQFNPVFRYGFGFPS
jgi:hypothetical protein